MMESLQREGGPGRLGPAEGDPVGSVVVEDQGDEGSWEQSYWCARPQPPGQGQN